MSYHGHLVVDTDSHIREYWDLDRTFKGNIDPGYRDLYERFSTAVKARQTAPGGVGFDAFYAHPPLRPLGVVDAFNGRAPAPTAGQVGAPVRGVVASGRVIDQACNWDPAVRLQDMDTAGIDASVLFPSQMDILCKLHDIGFERALTTAYHRYVSDFCAEAHGRIRWLGSSVMRDIAATVEQLSYWAEHDDNFAGLFVTRMCYDGSLLDSPDLYPIWERSQDLDLPVWIHGDPDHPPLTPGYAAMDNAAFARGVLKGWGGMTAMGALIGGGVFDLFPKLRVGFFENGASWMPWFVERLDEGYRPGSRTTPLLQRTPSEIVAGGQVFCANEGNEGEFGHSIDRLGEDLWLFSTDYPHPPAHWPDDVTLITERTDIAEHAKIKFLGSNATRFLPSLANVPV